MNPNRALTRQREPVYHAAMLDPHTGAELPFRPGGRGRRPGVRRAAGSCGRGEAGRGGAAEAYMVASSWGATSFLRLITPGSSIVLSWGVTPNARPTVATSPATSRSVPFVSTSVTISA